MPTNTPSTENNRSKIILLTIYFCFIVILGRLFYWQIIKGQELRDQATSQIYKLNTIFPQQGEILSSDGFPLSLGYTYYNLSLYKPNFQQSLPQILSEISSVEASFATENATFLDKFNNPAQKWMDFIGKFDRTQMQKLQNIPGISFTLKQARLYPEKNLAINIIQSLERYYQRKISGQVGFTRSAVDGTGEDLLTHINWQKNEIDGQNIQTSLNRQIQLLSENAIKDGVKKYQADSASVIIIKPQSGEIIAMASYEASPSATTKITNITDIFEPGSIFKPLVMAAGLDSGNLDRNFICDQCNHPRQIGQYTISNWNNELHPNSTLDDIIKNSDNIGMTYVMDKLTIDKFLVYFHKLKLDQKTGVELSGESISPPKTYWSDIDIATAAFGQGIAVNQLQMIQAFNAIANNGQFVDVHLNHLSPLVTTPVYKSNTITQMKGILRYAVENSPVNQFRPKDMDVCAKSGTAQVAVQGNYDNNNNTIGSYIGFSPCDNPKFTMIITINNPRSSPWGSSTAAPMWFELAQKLQPLL